MEQNKQRLGVSGEIGSFSEEAGLQYAARENIAVTIEYLVDMEGVLTALNQSRVDRAIFPVVNLHGGLVDMAFEAMGRHLFQPLDKLWLQVNHYLMVRPQVQRQQIEKIVSHPQALAQCRNYLNASFAGVEQLVWQDTAKAARALAQGELAPLSAVIAPRRCSEIYDLEIIASDIQDSDPNLTAFIIVENRSD
ncbi:MAG: chorismate mutase [Gammaproteobacteria bacterium]|nr:chorismate mutase [Gammaproteobacteria bacterium]